MLVKARTVITSGMGGEGIDQEGVQGNFRGSWKCSAPCWWCYKGVCVCKISLSSLPKTCTLPYVHAMPQ